MQAWLQLKFSKLFGRTQQHLQIGLKDSPFATHQHPTAHKKKKNCFPGLQSAFFLETVCTVIAHPPTANLSLTVVLRWLQFPYPVDLSKTMKLLRAQVQQVSIHVALQDKQHIKSGLTYDHFHVIRLPVSRRFSPSAHSRAPTWAIPQECHKT